MVSDFWRMWLDSLRVARGEGAWWRSPLVWAVALTAAAVASYGMEGNALATAAATPLVFVAGLLWMGLMVKLALHGPDTISGFVLGVVVLAVLMRIFLAVSRYVSW